MTIIRIPIDQWNATIGQIPNKVQILQPAYEVDGRAWDGTGTPTHVVAEDDQLSTLDELIVTTVAADQAKLAPAPNRDDKLAWRLKILVDYADEIEAEKQKRPEYADAVEVAADAEVRPR